MAKQSQLFIGTSGWMYGHWRGKFYPQDLPEVKWLEYYAQNFPAVEINSSFYHLPRPQTFKNWAQRVPKDFLFAVKLSRFVTHLKKLAVDTEPLTRFYSAAKNLGPKLGPILVQLPPSLKFSQQKTTHFLLLCQKVFGQKQPLTFEPRHPSWFQPESYRLLQKYQVALCWSDTPRYPYAEEVTADFVYIRLHGHEKLYASRYTLAQLRSYAQKIRTQLRAGRDVYVFFDNDAHAYAVENAKELQKLV